jgi:hypothetical protein
MLNTVMHDDFVWAAITRSLPASGRRSATNFTNINCPMCIYRSKNKTADKERKCGLKRDHQGIGIFCFRCGFKSRFVIGDLLSMSMKRFLFELGNSETEVRRMDLKAATYREMLGSNPEAAAMIPSLQRPSFPAAKLPEGSQSFTKLAEQGCTDPDFIAAATYLFNRGDPVANCAEFYWSPDKKDDMNRRIILPFYFDGRVVGYTARFIDKTPGKNRYHSQVPTNYLLNYKVLESQSQNVLLIEGVLDAKVMGGISPLGAKLSPVQIAQINATGQRKIVVPDRDKAGERLIQVALKEGWHVAFPTLKEGHGFNNWWDDDVGDCAEATKRYGKLYVLRSIMETATANPLEINVKRQLLY